MERKWYSVWPPDTPKSVKPERPFMDYLRDYATQAPDTVAISFYGYDMTYSELDNAIDRFAAGLTGLGVQKGDRVSLYMQNCPQFVISYLGVLRTGGIVVPMNPMFKHFELEDEINDCGARTMVALDYLYPKIMEIRERAKLRNIILTSLKDFLPEKPSLSVPSEAEYPKTTFPGTLDFLEILSKSEAHPKDQERIQLEDLALLAYTGGTTGLPKGAMITHATLAHNIQASIVWHHHTEKDVHLGQLPLFHAQGMFQSMFVALCSGGRLVLLTRFSPEAVAKAITQYGCTVWVTTPTTIMAMLEWPNIGEYSFSSFRLVGYGGVSLYTKAEADLHQLCPNANFYEGYALSETGTLGLLTPLHRPKKGFVGIPPIGVDLKVVDLETGTKEADPNKEGEIVIKGPPVTKGYWNKPDETAKHLREGWLYTGDIGIMDEEGYVRVVGRKKEMLKCSGFSVFPHEVEDLLSKHPAVSEVGVIGIPDPYRGESPKAFIVLKPESRGKTSEEEIIEWAKENMAAYKRPRFVEFRTELPRSGMGKVLRRVLVEEEKKKSER